jgi:hypothetical protein
MNDSCPYWCTHSKAFHEVTREAIQHGTGHCEGCCTGECSYICLHGRQNFESEFSDEIDPN